MRIIGLKHPAESFDWVSPNLSGLGHLLYWWSSLLAAVTVTTTRCTVVYRNRSCVPVPPARNAGISSICRKLSKLRSTSSATTALSGVSRRRPSGSGVFPPSSGTDAIDREACRGLPCAYRAPSGGILSGGGFVQRRVPLAPPEHCESLREVVSSPPPRSFFANRKSTS